ncbi:hypothetical protein QRX60_17305 [Amycolatopsis mongoliensis]|uniref:Uncharacterized protein n=1 Tax=Amycolatopsis mongoliensis TaxID=715475 RepID=A0A9Y2JVJ1_9PSEU|nr:hypothetical protein [Amycolatopsis sp. 4-36]WIY05516.1 hypothetical protein QRX60_17305 [Amycolatopsis sp. 4-36]
MPTRIRKRSSATAIEQAFAEAGEHASTGAIGSTPVQARCSRTHSAQPGVDVAPGGREAGAVARVGRVSCFPYLVDYAEELLGVAFTVDTFQAGLRCEAANTTKPTEVLGRSTPGFAEWYGNLSESEKDEQAEAGRNALSQLVSDDEPAPPRRRSPDSVDEEDFSEMDWLDG